MSNDPLTVGFQMVPLTWHRPRQQRPPTDRHVVVLYAYDETDRMSRSLARWSENSDRWYGHPSGHEIDKPVWFWMDAPEPPAGVKVDR